MLGDVLEERKSARGVELANEHERLIVELRETWTDPVEVSEVNVPQQRLVL
jgi:hypothetical protein